jgi:hypothetical protein
VRGRGEGGREGERKGGGVHKIIVKRKEVVSGLLKPPGQHGAQATRFNTFCRGGCTA